MADLLLAVIDLLRHVRMVERVEVEVDILVVQVVLVIGVHFHQQVILVFISLPRRGVGERHCLDRHKVVLCNHVLRNQLNPFGNHWSEGTDQVHKLGFAFGAGGRKPVRLANNPPGRRVGHERRPRGDVVFPGKRFHEIHDQLLVLFGAHRVPPFIGYRTPHAPT